VTQITYTENLTASPNRRTPLGTRLEAKLALRSRGCSKVMSPTSVPTVFGVVPLREFPTRSRPGRPAGSPQVRGQLRTHTPLEDGLDHLGQEPALPGQSHAPLTSTSEELVDELVGEHLPPKLATPRLTRGSGVGQPAAVADRCGRRCQMVCVSGRV